MKDEILNHWQIQESLLQSYRVLFLTSQSIIFSVGAVIAASVNPSELVFTILLLLGVVLLYLWFWIGRLRGLDVSYFQMLLLKNDRGDQTHNVMKGFKDWQTLARKDKIKMLNEFGLHKSKTRRILEGYVPLLFLFLWIGLSVVVFSAS